MIERTLIKIYAKALYQLADEKGRVDEVYDELRDLSTLFKDSKELYALLTSPKVDRKEKKRIIRDTLGPVCSRLTVYFLLTLIDKNREVLIPFMSEEFKEILDDVHNRIDVEVTSAIRLEDDMLRRIKDALSRVLQKEIVLQPRVDPDILGGIIVRVEDTVLDSSLKGRMERLRERMLGEDRRRVTANEDSA
jgi:F-type H+-transporting ATPase subunit delta